MNVNEIVKIVNGTVLTPQVALDREVKGGCGADLMSDVLSSIKPEAVLLTGLCNIQVVRTAQMADVCAIVFVRGKLPQPEIVELASQEGIPLITSPFGTFELCGRLYGAGLRSSEAMIPSSNNA
ncbi:MAG TPA: DRTGG domain-containing protein [Anaerolineales bacterium]|nr:DRTGG domain-containing protein [Anaerolineales bacterium]